MEASAKVSIRGDNYAQYPNFEAYGDLTALPLEMITLIFFQLNFRDATTCLSLNKAFHQDFLELRKKKVVRHLRHFVVSIHKRLNIRKKIASTVKETFSVFANSLDIEESDTALLQSHVKRKKEELNALIIPYFSSMVSLPEMQCSFCSKWLEERKLEAKQKQENRRKERNDRRKAVQGMRIAKNHLM